MKGTIRRRIAAFAVCALAVWLTIFPVFADPAQPEDEEVRRILEKSLSVVEIDKEIVRVQQQQQSVADQLQASQAKLKEQEQSIGKKRDDAGKVLRAYYTGERDIWLTAFVSVDNLSELLTLLDYFDLIFTHDKLTLNTYKTQYRELKKSIAKLDDQSKQLDELEEKLQTQRTRVVALQKDVDSSLSGRSDADSLRQLINEFNDFWQNVGLTEVRRYFSALSKAMKHMPAWVQDNKDEMLEINGFNYSLTIPEDKLNAFLREQNELFNTFAFEFKQDTVIVTGKKDNLEVRLTGHYTLEENGSILFHVDSLIFNGLELPDTTRTALEKEFDLGFYPSKIVSFLKTKSVSVEDGKLLIKLAISL
ncbi:coiled-coil domain-containing protein [Paenibacillus silvisoli]|uniref:coiled-coil domain-containing protein n=1 Tax=Paenibacillus silvisoli TaxID=3110539 RepID=UPI00280417A0|nr:hypothetical protein [Paenibacillus silvisoli]